MKKLYKVFISILSVAILIFSITAQTMASDTVVPVDFELTPLSVGTNLVQDGSITDTPPSGDWTVTVQYGTSSDKKSYGYSLKLPDSTQDVCGSQTAKVAGIKRNWEVKSANPNSDDYGTPIYAKEMLVGGDSSTLDDTKDSFDESNTAPQGTIVGVRSLTYYYKDAIPLSVFNDDQNQFYGYVSVVAPGPNVGDEFTGTVGNVSFSAAIVCGDSNVSGQNSGGAGGDPTNSAKSPKTGAGEVLIGTFIVALIASSFVVYKAIEKHRNTATLSEK